MNKEYNRLINDPFLNWLVVIAFATLIFTFSSMPWEELEENTGKIAELPDYTLHFIIYFVFGLSLFRALYTSGFKKAATVAITIGVLYGLSDEIHQIFTGRTFSLLDLLVDFIAVSVAQLGQLKNIYLK